MKTLTVREATKRISSCLESVYRRHESFEVVKNGVPYAHLVPANGTGCTTHELADDLAEADLTAADRRALASAVRRNRPHSCADLGAIEPSRPPEWAT